MEKQFWKERYKENRTGWEIGDVSPPLIKFVLGLNKDAKILIPGAGIGHDVEFLYNNGYSNINILDFIEAPLTSFKLRCPAFPINQIHQNDIFSFQGNFDVIIEQTLFCAINPIKRKEYIEKIHSLLNEEGAFAGVLFNKDFPDGPPFGGEKNEYLKLFKSVFSSVQMENCYNSIEPRMGSELFFIAKK